MGCLFYLLPISTFLMMISLIINIVLDKSNYVFS